MIETDNWINTDVKVTDELEPKLHKWLKGVLVSTPVTVTFTKVDGTERVMKCTLEADKLPAVELKEDAKPRKQSDSTKALRVFDLDKKEWRSFTIKNIKRIEFTIGGEDDKV
jgi:hypothetical protein